MNDVNVNGIVLDDTITKQLAELQDDYARILSDGLGNIMDCILGDCMIDSRCSEKKLLEYLQIIHYTRKALMKLVPEKKGGEQ